MKRRRSGTVSSIALNANSKPTSALIAANSAVDWSFGATACLQQPRVARRRRRSFSRPSRDARERAFAAARRCPGSRVHEHARDASVQSVRAAARRRAARATSGLSERADLLVSRAAARPARSLRVRAHGDVDAIADVARRAPAPAAQAARGRAACQRGARRESSRSRSRAGRSAGDGRRRSGRPCGRPLGAGAADVRARRPARRARTPGSRATCVERRRRRSRAGRAPTSCSCGVAGDAAHELLDRRGDACVRDLDREHERDADGDPDEREQLLQRMRADALDVEEEEVARLHRSDSAPAAAPVASSARRAAGGRGRRRSTAGRIVRHEQPRRRRARGRPRRAARAPLRSRASRGCRSARRRARRRGSFDSARASATRWRSPRDSCVDAVLGALRDAEPVEQRRDATARVMRGSRRSPSASARRCRSPSGPGISRKDWNTKPSCAAAMARGGAARERRRGRGPSNSTLPASGRAMPAATNSSVDLPDPLGP